jgi:hypothetical protein
VERARLLRAQAGSGFAANRAARRRYVERRPALHGEQGTIKTPAAISERAYGYQPSQKRRPDYRSGVHLVGAANYAKGTVSCAKGAADDWMKAIPAPRRLVRLVIELAGCILQPFE